MRTPTANQVSRVAGVVSLLLVICGIISCANIVQGGRGGNIGAGLLGLLFYCLAVIAAIVWLVARYASRRQPPRGFEPIMSADRKG